MRYAGGASIRTQARWRIPRQAEDYDAGPLQVRSEPDSSVGAPPPASRFRERVTIPPSDATVSTEAIGLLHPMRDGNKRRFP